MGAVVGAAVGAAVGADVGASVISVHECVLASTIAPFLTPSRRCGELSQ